MVVRCGPCLSWAVSVPAVLSAEASELGTHARWSQPLSSSDLQSHILVKQKPGVDQ